MAFVLQLVDCYCGCIMYVHDNKLNTFLKHMVCLMKTQNPAYMNIDPFSIAPILIQVSGELELERHGTRGRVHIDNNH